MTQFGKPALTTNQQVELLICRGMRITDRERARHYLAHINYYRLRAYWLPFELAAIGDGDHGFQPGIDFDTVIAIYDFDRELRLLLLDAIERVEISLRTRWANELALRYGPLPREIQEVRNAFAAYEQMNRWQPSSVDDLLAAHGVLMAGLLDEAGEFRTGKVGIYRGEALVYMAPPARRVPGLMRDLFDWLARGEVSPLVASCVFHYEFEFIHPFADGNGRMGRLWQTLILSRWKPLLAYLPVETVIREQQAAYYQALTDSDSAAEATPFVAFMLQALLTAIGEVALTDQVSDQVSDQVKRLLTVFRDAKTLKAAELMAQLGLQHRPTFRNNYLNPALAAGLIEMTQPDSPRSPAQQYRLTAKGRSQ